jgi:hypothetical protein
MALPNDGIPPDRLELRLRSVCGAVAGAILGASAAFQLDTDSLLLITILTTAGCVIGGVLARHYGDRFWRSLPWWW